MIGKNLNRIQTFSSNFTSLYPVPIPARSLHPDSELKFCELENKVIYSLVTFADDYHLKF